MNRRVFVSVLLTLLIVGAIGFGVWQAGYDQGVVAGVDTDVIVGPRYYPGYWPGYYGLGVFGLFFKVLFLFLLIGFIAKLFFWRRWKHAGPHPKWDRGDMRSAMEERMTEWHRKAHSGEPSDD